MPLDVDEPTKVIRPQGPQRMATADPVRAALYRYGNAAIKPIYPYFQEEGSLREVLQQEQAAREHLVADLATLGKHLPAEPLAHFCRQVRRAGELWGLGQINSNQARHIWKRVARQAQSKSARCAGRIGQRLRSWGRRPAGGVFEGRRQLLRAFSHTCLTE